jgi:hypothetical protein
MRDVLLAFAQAILAVAVMDSAWPPVLHLPEADHYSLDSGGYLLGLLCVALALVCQVRLRVFRHVPRSLRP